MAIDIRRRQFISAVSRQLLGSEWRARRMRRSTQTDRLLGAISQRQRPKQQDNLSHTSAIVPAALPRLPRFAASTMNSSGLLLTRAAGSGGRALSSCTGTRLTPRDIRRASHNLPTGDGRAQIDRVHNHSSRATTGPMPCRPGVAPQQRYEHKVKSRNNNAT
jgi:hypothetical protein